MSELLTPISAMILPIPPGLHAPTGMGLFFTIWAGGLGLVVIPWALWRYFTKRDDVPLWMIVAGFICSLLEPMLDHLGHLWWPTNLPGPAFIGYQIHVPYLIPTCYVFFISMTGYFAYTRIKAGLSMKGLFITWLLIAMTDIVMELPGTATGVYVYYGDASFKVLGYPLAWGWINGTSMLMVGVLLSLIDPILKGANRVLLSLTSVMAMGATFGMVAWPYFMSLNWGGQPWIVSRVLTLVSLVLSIMVIYFAGLVVTRQAGQKATA